MKSIDNRWIRSAVTVFVSLFFVSALPWRELRADAISHSEYDCSPLSVTYDQVSSWDTTTQAEFTITNTSEESVKGWILELTFPMEVSTSNIWNAVDLTSENIASDTLIIANQAYNSSIDSGETITFGVILEGTEFAPTAPVNVTLVVEPEEEIIEIPEDNPEEEPVAPDTFSYAIYTASDITISGYQNNIYGDIYSGTNFVFQGSELNVEGTVRTVGYVNASGYITEIDSIEENIEGMDIPDWEEFILDETTDMDVLSSDVFNSQTDMLII